MADFVESDPAVNPTGPPMFTEFPPTTDSLGAGWEEIETDEEVA